MASPTIVVVPSCVLAGPRGDGADGAEGHAEQHEAGVVTAATDDAEHHGRADAGEHRGQARLLAGEAEALEGAGALEGEVVDEGEQRGHAGQRGPAGRQARRGGRRARRRRTPASTSGAGRAVVAPMPPASATTDTANAERSTTDRSVIAAQPNVSGGDHALGEEQGGPVELGVDADGGDVDRHEERAEVEERAGGGGERGLEAATGEQEAAGGEEEDPELHGVGDGAPVHRHEHGGGGEEQEGTRAGHPDGAGAGGVGTEGSGRDGALVAVMPPPSADPGLGGPGGPPRGPWGTPIRCRAPGRSARAPASG